MLLELAVSNVMPDLNFLRTMKHITAFDFSVKVLNGDLRPCLGISSVFSFRDRRPYNLRDSSLPKGKFKMGNEPIEGIFGSDILDQLGFSSFVCYMLNNDYIITCLSSRLDCETMTC